MLPDLLQWLVQSTVASSAAILLVLVLRRPLRAAFGAGIAYALWALVPLLIVAVLLPAPIKAVAAPVVAAMQAPVQVFVATATRTAGADMSLWYGIAWLVGALASIGWMLSRQRRFERGLGSFDQGSGDVVVANATAGLPAVVGLWRPRIVLPRDAAQRYDARQRELMLAHERTHIARGDMFANAGLALLRAVYWFNPLVHLAAARFRHDQELACDQQVMARHPNARRSYGEAMLKTQLAGLAPPLACHWGQTHPLKERIDMLRKPLPSVRRRALGTAVATGLLLSCAYAVWAAQPTAATSTSMLQAQAGADYNARVEISMDGGTPTSIALSGTFGQPLVMHQGDATGTPLVTAQALPVLKDGLLGYDITMRIEQDGKLLAAPRIMVADGKTATIKQGTERDGVFEGIQLDVTVNARDAQQARAQAKPFEVSSQVTAKDADPQLRLASPPKYPQLAAEQKIEGRVMLIVDVAADGSVAAVQLDRSSGDASLDAAAMEAAKLWKYQPAVESGKPVAARVRVPIDFNMDPPAEAEADRGDYYIRPNAEQGANAGGFDRMIASFGEGIWKPVMPPRPSADDC